MAVMPCTGLAQAEPDWSAGGTLFFDETATWSTPVNATLPLSLVVADGVRLRLEGEITTPLGGIGLIKDGPGRLELAGESPDFERNTLLREGTLHLEGLLPLGPYYRVLQAQVGTTLSYGDGAVIQNLLSLQPGANEITGDTADNTVYWRVDQGSARHVGDVDGEGLLVKQGAGTLEFAGMAVWPETGLDVAQGQLTLDGFFAGTISLGAGTVLRGTGRTGRLTVGTGAYWAPGGSLAGTLSISRGLSVAPGSTLAVRAWPDGASDRVVVDQGAVSLAGTVLALPQGLPEDWVQVSEYRILQANAGLGEARFDTVEAAIPWLTPGLHYTDDSVWLTLAPLTTPEPEVPAPDGPEPELPEPELPEPEIPEPETDEPENGTQTRPKRERRWPTWTAPERPRTPAAPETPPAPDTPKEPVEPPRDNALPPGPPEEQEVLPEAPSEAPAETPSPTPPETPPASETEPEPEVLPETETAAPSAPATPAAPRPYRPQQHEGWLATVQNLLTEDSRFLRKAVWHAQAQPDGFWLQGFGHHRRHREHDGNGKLRAQARSGGLFLGVQGELRPGLRMGAVLGASHSRFSGSTATTATVTARADSVHAGLYAQLGRDEGPQLTLGGGVHRHHVRSQRPIALIDPATPARLNSRWNSHQVFARVAWPLVSSWPVVLTPWAEWAWTASRMPALTESGYVLAIHTQARRQQLQTVRLGLNAAMSVGEAQLHARVAWRHHSGNTNPALQLHYVHDPARNGFVAQGLTPVRQAWQFGTDVTMPLGKHGQWRLGVEGESGRGLRAYGATMRVVWRF